MLISGSVRIFRTQECKGRIRSMNPEEKVEILKGTTSLLLQCGFRANQPGYRYLREAVLIASQEEEAVTSVTKLLYPEVARRFKVSDKQVERAIRSTIETAWIKGNQEVLHEVFSGHFEKTAARPTNTAVIKTLRDKISEEQWV